MSKDNFNQNNNNNPWEGLVKQFRNGEWGDYIYKEKDGDSVNHPSHYNQGEIETIDIIKELTRGYTGFEAYLVGNVIKYIARANFKGNKKEDLEKAEFYYKRLLKEGESSL